MKYSIIFLVDEESEEFCPLFDLIYRIFEENGEGFEVLVVANGTESFVTTRLDSRRNCLGNIKVMAFPRRAPQPVCMKAALSECGGEKVLALGSFQELTAESYEKIVDSMTSGADLVVPFRKLRKDPFLNRLHSRVLNKALKTVLGVKLNDIGCNVKFMRREVLEDLELYGNLYRYLPVLAVQKGFHVKEVECEQLEKTRKTSFYRFRLYLDRLIEILNLFFSTNFSRKPLRFFNLVGSGFMIAGFLALLFVGMEKILLGKPLGARPLLIIGMISLVGGTQIASFGLLGEIVSFVYGRLRKEYTIEKIV